MTAHTCTKHEPGASCYRSHGCRCDGCITQVRRQKKLSRAGVIDLVPIGVVRAHIAHLAEVGYTYHAIGVAAGLKPGHVPYLMETAERCHVKTARAILAISDAGGLVDATGTHRRVRALNAVGWTCATLARRMGNHDSAVSRMLSASRVTPDTARRVGELYEELWDQPPPEATVSERSAARRNRTLAARNGWAPPAAWDDGTGPHGIDNPKARPYPWKRRDSDSRSRHDISDLRAVGLTDTEIAHRLGIQPESLQRRHAA